MLPEEFIKEKIYEMLGDVDELNEWECQVADLLINYALSINSINGIDPREDFIDYYESIIPSNIELFTIDNFDIDDFINLLNCVRAIVDE